LALSSGKTGFSQDPRAIFTPWMSAVRVRHRPLFLSPAEIIVYYLPTVGNAARHPWLKSSTYYFFTMRVETSSMLTSIVPKYRHQKSRNLAVVRIGGQDHYLGPWKSKASYIEYDRLIAEWLANGRTLTESPDEEDIRDVITVAEVVARYWEYAKDYYGDTGRRRGAANNLRPTLKLLRTVSLSASKSMSPKNSVRSGILAIQPSQLPLGLIPLPATIVPSPDTACAESNSQPAISRMPAIVRSSSRSLRPFSASQTNALLPLAALVSVLDSPSKVSASFGGAGVMPSCGSLRFSAPARHKPEQADAGQQERRGLWHKLNMMPRLGVPRR